MKDLKLLTRSTKAVCGISERAVNVATKNLKPAINQLKQKGFHIVGTSYNTGPTKTIWFIRPGSL